VGAQFQRLEDTQNGVATFSYTAKSGTASEFSHGERPPETRHMQHATGKRYNLLDIRIRRADSGKKLTCGNLHRALGRIFVSHPFTIWTEAPWQES